MGRGGGWEAGTFDKEAGGVNSVRATEVSRSYERQRVVVVHSLALVATKSSGGRPLAGARSYEVQRSRPLAGARSYEVDRGRPLAGARSYKNRSKLDDPALQGGGDGLR